ncbi:MAG: tyrosine-protein phosphatase [Sedimentisphaerales bacterium]
MTVNDSKVYSTTGRRRVIVAGLLIVTGLAIWAWFGIIRYHVIPKRFGVVEQGRIYRSGQLSAPLVKKVLADHNIRVIVDLTNDDPKNQDQQAEKKAAAELNIKVLRFPMSGKGTGDVNDYASAVAAIANAEKQNLPVLVHCAAGAQRTGGVIAMFRLLVQKKDPAFVISEMKRYGWNAKDNPDLLPYLDGNMALLAEMLKQAGVINEAPSPLPKLSHN